MKENLLPYPKDWKNLLNLFKNCFTKPQFNNFSQATTCVAVSQYSTMTRWSKLFSKKHQSTLNDFYTTSPWLEHNVHSRLSRLIVTRVKDAYVGIIDDTLSHKPYAQKMAHLGIFRDGLTKKKQKGHSIVTHGVQSLELGFVPFDTQLYQKNGRTKNDIACAMIQRTQHYRKLPLYVVDSWYSNTQVLGKITDEKSHYISEVKSNRNVTINYKCRYAKEHATHIEEKGFTQVKIRNTIYRFFQTSAFISGLGNVNLVFSQKYEESEEDWGDFHYLITDVLSLPGERVIELFLLRGGTEGFHREAKQHLGLETYQLRNDRGIERYLFLVLLVYVLLLAEPARDEKNLRKKKGHKRALQTSEGRVLHHYASESKACKKRAFRSVLSRNSIRIIAKTRNFSV